MQAKILATNKTAYHKTQAKVLSSCSHAEIPFIISHWGGVSQMMHLASRPSLNSEPLMDVCCKQVTSAAATTDGKPHAWVQEREPSFPLLTDSGKGSFSISSTLSMGMECQ